MRNLVFTSLFISALIVSVTSIHANENDPQNAGQNADKTTVHDTTLINAAGTFSFGSDSFKDGDTLSMKHVFNSFGCSGKNISPELHWANPPKGTKSYVLTVYDPDAPTGSGWWHWTAYNIPLTTTSLKEGEKLPASAGQGRTDFGKPGYGGPCPPPGNSPHHYVFTLYAIKEAKLPLNKEASGAMVGFMANANSIAKLSITALFGR